MTLILSLKLIVILILILILILKKKINIDKLFLCWCYFRTTRKVLLSSFLHFFIVYGLFFLVYDHIFWLLFPAICPVPWRLTPMKSSICSKLYLDCSELCLVLAALFYHVLWMLENVCDLQVFLPWTLYLHLVHALLQRVFVEGSLGASRSTLKEEEAYAVELHSNPQTLCSVANSIYTCQRLNMW